MEEVPIISNLIDKDVPQGHMGVCVFFFNVPGGTLLTASASCGLK